MRIKNTAYTVLFLFLTTSIFSQVFNNEWINFSQKYYKIKIAKDGIYRIDSAALANAGIPISTINPLSIQLFHKGQEIYSYISGEGDGVLNTNDYILFYAEKNSCKDDSLLYNNVPFLTNPYYSVINDTSAVFFTWNSSLNNKRLKLNTDTTYSQNIASPYYYKEVYTVMNDYGLGPLNFLNQDDPRYRLGEGLYYREMSTSSTDGLNINTSAAYISTLPAYFTFCISGANDFPNYQRDHFIQIDYIDNAGTQILSNNDSLIGYYTYRNTYTVSPANFGATTNLRVTALTSPYTAIADYIHINYIRALYPQQFDMLGANEEKIYLPDDISGQNKSKMVITNFGGTSPVMIDVTNHRLLTVTASGGNFLVLDTNSGGSKFCFLSDIINAVNTITAVNSTGSFVDYQTVLPNLDLVYLIVSHPKLIGGVNSGVNQYKNYRNSIAGGSFPVILASITDLYDQFAFGVEFNPLSIRNFCASIIANTAKDPSNLLLIGKGIHAFDFIYDLVSMSKCLVPTWGNPSCDNLITQGLPGSINMEPAIPTGRIAAQSDQDVLSYLSKVVLHDQQNDDSLWKKQALHFIGGANYFEQQALNSYLLPSKLVFQDTSIGGKVFSFYKTSTAPSSSTTNDSVRQIINSGVSLITFLGHGSPTGWDQSLDDPQNYNNSPRFPLILSNSCYTGDIHNGNQLSHSEVYVLAPNNHGCIGYIAEVSSGVADRLGNYMTEFYKNLAYKNYGQSYGACIKNTVRQLVIDLPVKYGNDTVLFYALIEKTLHGDPAVRPYSFTKPDYTLKNSDIIFKTNAPIEADSIGLQIIMTNLGKAIKDSFTVFIERNFPNGDTVNYYKRVKAPYYVDTLKLKVAKEYYRAVGQNSFCVTLDHLNFVAELSEINNKTNGCVSLFIPGADIEPVWPYKYAIVPNTYSVTLKASTADPFAPITTYKFQVDTCDSFITPFINTTVTAPGGVVSLPINFSAFANKDSLVYFWRVAKDTLWKESSFQVLTGKYGWGQAHFHQFKNDAYQYVKYDKPARKFTFVDDVKTIQVNTGLYPQVEFTKTQFYYNNAQERLWTCSRDGWIIACFDPITGNLIPSDTLGGHTPVGDWLCGKAWIGSNHNCICCYVTRNTFDFGKYDYCGDVYEWKQSMVDFINNIPDGTPVLAYTVKMDEALVGVPQDTVTPAMIAALQGIGSGKIASGLADSSVMVIFGKKGDPIGSAHDTISSYKSQLLTFVDSIKTQYYNGYIASEIIGPCKYSDTAWKSLHWHYTNLEPSITSKDSIVIQLYGINASGQKILLATFPKDSLDVLDLSNYVSGKQYPKIQLIAQEADLTLNTPPQLGRWQVIFDQAPECAIHPPAGFSVVKNPVAEAETFEVRVPIKNISDFSFDDSLLVTYYLQDANRVNHILPYKLKNKPFVPDQVIIDTILINTLGYAGNDVFWIDINPPGVAKYQPEQFHFNNIAQIAFGVTKDNINPLLDVTFDGVHILNGDIVSAKPNIFVTLKDENKFLALNDTSNFIVKILTPGSTVETRLFFKDVLQFTPAQLPNNSCKINYHPTLTQDGVYMLHIYATDRSKNISGQIDYKIQFDIVNKPSITEVLNYPNPFSTSTKFVFTITGSEIPETFKIQILSITGRVIREITREELGFLHVGRNITDYAWDGKDQFGDQLANGVYLYRVQTRLHGDEIEHLSTAADAYIKKGYGKMLLMR